MASNDIVLRVKAKDDASATFSVIQGKAKGMGSALGTALKSGALVGGVALAGLGAASLKMAVDFERSFSEVKTLLPNLSEEGFGQLKKDILAVSQEMGIATNESIPALYQAISAAVPADNVLGFMTVASQAAIGGVTSLEVAVDGITSVTNSYSDELHNAQLVSDQMFTAVRLGKTDFEQLSASLFNVIPTASSLGIKFDEVAAAMAVMTAQGVPTSVATTQLRQAFVEASKSGSKLDEALKNLSGQSFAQLIEAGGSASGIFEDLRQSMPDQEFKDLFGSVESMNAVLQITGPNAEAMASALDEMKGSAGATEAAFGVMSDTASFKLNKAINILKIELMKLGSEALPVLVQGLEAALPWLQEKVPAAIAEMKQVFEDIKPTLLSLGAAFLTGMGVLKDAFEPVFNFIIENKAAMIAAITAIGVAILLAFGPGAVAIAALVGLVVLIGLIKDNWDSLKLQADEVFDAAQMKVTETVGSIITTLEGIPVIGEAIAIALDVLKVAVETYFEGYKIFIETTFNAIKDFFQIWIAIFNGDWNLAWTETKELVLGIWGGIQEGIELILTAVVTIVGGIPARILAAVGDLGVLLYGTGAALMQGMANGIQAVWSNVRTFFVNLPGYIVSALGDVGSILWQKGKDLIQGLINGMFSVPIPNPLDLIPGIPSVPGLPNLNPFRASGGPVSAGGSYIVGERGPELFSPGSSGNITPNSALGGGNNYYITIQTLDDTGVDAAADRLAEAINRKVQGAGGVGLMG